MKNEQVAKRQKVERDAADFAIVAVINQPELSHGSFPVGAAVEEAKAPHVTHELRHVANGEAPIIF